MDEDLEQRIYERMCSACPNARKCHEDADEYSEAVGKCA